MVQGRAAENRSSLEDHRGGANDWVRAPETKKTRGRNSDSGCDQKRMPHKIRGAIEMLNM